MTFIVPKKEYKSTNFILISAIDLWFNDSVSIFCQETFPAGKMLLARSEWDAVLQVVADGDG